MTQRTLNQAAIDKMVAEAKRTILRLRIACYLTDNGQENKELASDIAFFLMIGAKIGALRWPQSRPTAITVQAFNSLMDVAEDGWRWQNRIAPLLDGALDRSEWIFTKYPHEAIAQFEVARLAQQAVLNGAAALTSVPNPQFLRVAA